MNAVSVLQGLIEGGNDGARKTMRKFWEGVGEKGKDGPLKPMGDDKKRGNYTMYNSFGYIMFDNMIKNMSPYQFNKDDKDPLKEVIEEQRLTLKLCLARQSTKFSCVRHTFVMKK